MYPSRLIWSVIAPEDECENITFDQYCVESFDGGSCACGRPARSNSFGSHH
jgi:hypothetical protein